MSPSRRLRSCTGCHPRNQRGPGLTAPRDARVAGGTGIPSEHGTSMARLAALKGLTSVRGARVAVIAVDGSHGHARALPAHVEVGARVPVVALGLVGREHASDLRHSCRRCSRSGHRTRGRPRSHCPSMHWSFRVQGSPSLRDPATASWAQPPSSGSCRRCTGFHRHRRGSPPMHWPSAHMSMTVQSLPSSQAALVGT